MPAKTPVLAGTVGYVDKVRGIYTGVRPLATDALLTVGSIDNNRLRFRQLLYYFADLDDLDTWASGILGIKGLFWSGDTLTDQANAALSNADGTVTFSTPVAGNANGWLLVLIDSDNPAHGFSQR